MSQRQRRAKAKRRRHAQPAGGRARPQRARLGRATLSGGLAATAAVGLATGAESASAENFDAAQVADIRSGASGAAPNDLTNVNGTLFFNANDGTNGFELWKSDGTTAGTALVKDIRSGAGDGNPYFLTDVNGTLFFSANDGTNGYELWKSDGTTAGTVLVKDINSGATGSYPTFLTNVSGTLFFRANDGAKDRKSTRLN